MRTLLAALCIAIAHPLLSAGELRDEIDSFGESFHQALHVAPEIYLVCYYQVDKKPWAKEWERLEIKATVVEVIRGERKVGDRIEFDRVLDGKYGDISKLPGSLNYVQYYRNDQEGSPEFGKLNIDPQDPAALFRFSSELSVIAAEHKEAQQAGTEQPATSPELKSEGGDKLNLESEGLSQ